MSVSTADEEGPGVALGREARRCGVAAAVVPVAGLVEPPPLPHASERAHRRHDYAVLRRGVRFAARRYGPVERRPSVTGGPQHGGRIHRGNAVVVDPVLELVGVETDEAADLHDGDAPLVGQPAHVAQARAQPERDVLQGKEGHWLGVAPRSRNKATKRRRPARAGIG